MNGTVPSALEPLLRADPGTFALLHRPETTGPDTLEILTGGTTTVPDLASIPLPDAVPGAERERQVLALVPFRQVAERGYSCTDDATPLMCMTVDGETTVSVAEALRWLPRDKVRLTGEHFDVDDEEYAGIVRKVISDEIGTGEGANFVIKRSFVADITDYTPAHALAFFAGLLERERGAYWTFLVRTPERTLVGATPERHISLRDGRAVMNPISGTYRYPAAGPDLPGVLGFLADEKEADELYMVVDEELKMMSRVCESAPRVTGPHLKEMARLAHTEYFIEGESEHDPRDILRETLFAPTVTGSPLESACKVISRYEPPGRGYYSGVMALIGQDALGRRTLDSSILIRTADIDTAGRMRIGVGATLVRHSDPDSEVAETRAKAAGLLASISASPPGARSADVAAQAGPEAPAAGTAPRPKGAPASFGAHPDVIGALAGRNGTIADFWLGGGRSAASPPAALAGRSVLVVDAEDTFTSMIDHQLRALGLRPTVVRFDAPHRLDEHDLVVMGPGPGDPRDAAHPKIAHLQDSLRQLIDRRLPFLAVCLSHQVLSTLLGLDLVRRPTPNQGVQRGVDLFGAAERVGFYNTFAARSAHDSFDAPGVGTVRVSRDPATGEVHALRGPRFASMQFHAESLLTEDGIRITGDALTEVLR